MAEAYWCYRSSSYRCLWTRKVERTPIERHDYRDSRSSKKEVANDGVDVGGDRYGVDAVKKKGKLMSAVEDTMH